MNNLVFIRGRQQGLLLQHIRTVFVARQLQGYTLNNEALFRTCSRTVCNSSGLQKSRSHIPFKLLKHSEFIHIQHGQLHFSRHFHISGRKNALPPLIWAAVSFASKTGAVLTGRRLRNRYRVWVEALPVEEQEKHHKRRLQFFASLGAFCVSMCLLYYYTHEQVCPITGRKRFLTLTKDQSMKIADYETENFVDLCKDITLPATDPQYNLVLRTAQRIVRANQDFPGMNEQKWVIHVVEDEEKNAFVLPNGNIFVFTGILNFVETEDQLAVILAHEMSHALLLHGAEQLSYSQFLDKIVILAMAAIWTLMPNDGVAVVTNWFYNKVMDLTLHAPYSRTLEKEADRVGLHLMAKACYDVREGSVLWYRFSVDEDMTGEGRFPEWLSTHPAHGNRVKHIDQLIPKAIEEREKCKCERLSDLDPRKRAVQMRKEADNVMIARATKANLDRVHKDYKSSVVPTFQSPVTSSKAVTASSLVDA